ncbi:kynureninase [Puniceibacterium sp. IMCC21224]|uniref:kynureninase n=1 Tax=Puniceibacterium sp. IMCC21224 TaxID=1618204 RepID=UPI00064DE886|nr:kynureninase [Puniceibacterium sp. IMCC21224]KMK67854.1 Kynureninase [Puniceibacterium sp. IMCC21224]
MTDFNWTREQFHIPLGMIYLDGNSLGALPKMAPDRVLRMMEQEWGQQLITGWNASGWMEQPTRIGNRIARLIGAQQDHVVLGDTLSIKVFQALASALTLRPDRRVILSDTGNFPSDLYMAQGLTRLLDRGHELRLVAPEEVEGAITEDVAVTLITEVDYRTGRRHDMPALTAKAHEKGALSIWDLAHSAGAFGVDVAGGGADFAVGCTYKYLNGGPGSPAFIYVAPEHAEHAQPALAGWLGHAQPFDFDQTYSPGAGIQRMRVGTPPVLQMTALESALEVWDQVDMDDLRARSIELSERFLAGVEQNCPQLQLFSPRAPEQRGSQVSFQFENGYAVIQALISEGVIGDFRAPDVMRFGFTPLYLNERDVDEAVAILTRVMRGALWDTPKFMTRKTVT